MLYLYILAIVIGLILVIYGGDIFVDSAVIIAKRFKIPVIIIGATIVSIATTLPELIVSTISSSAGNYELAVGNAVGSTICNTALICGISMAIVPTILHEKTSPIKLFILLISCGLLFVFGYNYNIVWWESLIFECIFVGYIVFNVLDAIKQSKLEKSFASTVDIKEAPVQSPTETPLEETPTILEDFEVQNVSVEKKGKKLVERFPNIIVTILFFLLGAGMVALGAWLLIQGCTYVATAIGISQSFIGLTVVAIGTSLPELITTITSIKKKSTALGYGNIIGANILNITLIMGTSGLISGQAGLPLTQYTLLVSIPFTLILSVIFVLPILLKNKTYRWQGITLLTLYVLYVTYLIVMTCLGYTV